MRPMIKPYRAGLPSSLSRRSFNRQMGFAAAGLTSFFRQTEPVSAARIALAKGKDPSSAVRNVIDALGEFDCQGKDIYIKANFNSSDEYPASTRPETLAAVAGWLRESNCANLTLVERSGMGRTSEIWGKLGIPDVAARFDMRLLALEDLAPDGWNKKALTGSHWKNGVEVPRFLDRGAAIVQVCNLKTHRFGGQFSASLKNSIGLIAKFSQSGAPRNYMEDLHNSPDQRLMIAEANQVYAPSLIIMDAGKVFIDGGPEAGELAEPGVFAASRDRIAVDSVGVSLLRIHGAGDQLNRSAVFELEQIQRAVELKLGAGSPDQIQFIHDNAEIANLALRIQAILSSGSPSENKN
jgi:uncharacterized protein (DUF362 family)